jgi:hypothetical protein
MGRWKALFRPSSLKMELYDLLSDPSEKFNLASKHRELTHAFYSAMKYSHLQESKFPLLPSEMSLGTRLRWRIRLAFDRGVLFPELWPPRTKGSNRACQENVAAESTVQTLQSETQASEIYANLRAEKEVHLAHGDSEENP